MDGARKDERRDMKEMGKQMKKSNKKKIECWESNQERMAKEILKRTIAQKKHSMFFSVYSTFRSQKFFSAVLTYCNQDYGRITASYRENHNRGLL